MSKVLNPTIVNKQGFRERIPWIEFSQDVISWPGAGGALAADAVTSWIRNGLELMGGFDSP